MSSFCRFLFVCLVLACVFHASNVSSASLTPAPVPVVVFPAEGCTAMAFGPKSSPDGAMTTHTNDCKDCDFRLSLVPGAKHAQGSTRPVPLSRFSYPRYVGNDRGEALKAEHVDTTIHAWGPSEPIGSIPQASETYSYIDGTYGIMNEHQVAMGESTCSARLVSKPLTQGGEAMFDIAELGRVALERTKTARDAIKLMGSLGETYGYYGAEWEGDYAYAEAGEALTVTDPNEAWVFHILPDDTGKSAVWVAQRVPDDHVAVVANQFTIGEIDLNNTDYFLGSSNIHEVAIRNDFWDPSGDEPFHFSRVYSCHILYEIYCSRRIWRVYDVFAPSLHLNPNSTVLELPFSIKPDREVKIRDVMNMQRDHYEGTPFDMTKGLAAGPYGNPNRYDRGSVENVPMGILMQGTFERAISLFRTSYSFVSQSRSSLPSPIGGVLWFGESAPHSTCYVPFYPASTSLPLVYQTGSLYQYSRDSAWWSFTVVSNWAERMYRYIMQDVQSAQSLAETSQFDQQKSFESHALQVFHEKNDIDAVKQMLTSYHTENAQNVFKTWNALFEYLIAKYHDGYRLDDFHAATINPTSIFYPIDWLQAVGFFNHGIDWNHTTYTYTSFPEDVRQRNPDLTRTDAPAVRRPNATRDDTTTHSHKSTPSPSDNNGYVTPTVASPHDNTPSTSLDNAPPIPQRSESQPVTSWGRHINPNQTRPSRPGPGILPNATDEAKVPVITQPHDDVPISPYPYPNYQIPSSPDQPQTPASASASAQSLIAIPTPTTTAPRSLWAFDVLLFAISGLICMMLGIYIGRKWERHEYQEIAEMEPLNGMGHRTWA